MSRPARCGHRRPVGCGTDCPFELRIAMATERSSRGLLSSDRVVSFGDEMQTMDNDLTQRIWLYSGEQLLG